MICSPLWVAVAALCLCIDAKIQTKRHPLLKRAGKLDEKATVATPDFGFVTNGYLVELESEGDLSSLGKRSDALDHTAIYSHLEKRKVKYNVRQEFSSDVFTGASLVLQNAADAAHLASVPGVKSVSRIRKLWPAGRSPWTGTGGSSKKHGCSHTPKPWKPTPGKNQTLPPDYNYGPHVQTGVNKLHAAGITGKGVKVAFIDSGIDYLHPLLGGGFGPGYRVAKGYDFVGNNFGQTGVPVPGPDPFSSGCYLGAHGTLVAGVGVGAVDAEVGWSGVAPDATIYAYKVLDCTATGVGSDIIMQALLRAVKDGADVINLSLSKLGSWEADPYSQFLKKLVDKSGVLVAASTGDVGGAGLFFGAAPSTAPNVFAVGADNQPSTIEFNVTTSTGYGPISFYGSHDFNFTNIPVYALSPLGTANDACAPLPASTPNLAGKLTIIGRGGCPYAVKATNAINAGATSILVYNQPDLVLSPVYSDQINNGLDSGNFGVINAADGAYLVNQFFSNPDFRVSSNNPKLFQQAALQPGLVNINSGGNGPTFDLYNSISLVAPGFYMLSTSPTDLGFFTVGQGTSFSTPYLAGALALYIQQKRLHRPFDVAAVRGVFTSTAQTVSGSFGFPGLDPVAAQGAGRLDAYSAVLGTATQIEPSIFNLNDTAYFAGKQTLTITNGGKLPKVYTLSHTPVVTVYTDGANSSYPSNWPQNGYSNTSASVVFGYRRSIVVLPRRSAKVPLTFSFPTGLDPARLPIYSGFINVKSADGESFSVPYQGVAEPMKNVQVLDSGAAIAGVPLPAIADGQFNVQNGPKTYTYVGPSYPQLVVRFLEGSAVWSIQAVPANFTLPASNSSKPFLAYNSVGPILGTLPGLSGTYQSRNVNDASVCYLNPAPCVDVPIIPWNGNVTLANGNQQRLPNGGYKVLINALKITGDPKNWFDYEHQLTYEIDIARPS